MGEGDGVMGLYGVAPLLRRFVFPVKSPMFHYDAAVIAGADRPRELHIRVSLLITPPGHEDWVGLYAHTTWTEEQVADWGAEQLVEIGSITTDFLIHDIIDKLTGGDDAQLEQ